MKITGTDGAVMGSSWNGDGASCLRLESAGLVPAARDDAGGTRPRVVQPTVRAALRMTLVTAPGSLIMDRCGALISVMRDPARWAMTTCSAGGVTWWGGAVRGADDVPGRDRLPGGRGSQRVRQDAGGRRLLLGRERGALTGRQAVGEAPGEHALLDVRLRVARGG